jgi:hypothetical protein
MDIKVSARERRRWADSGGVGAATTDDVCVSGTGPADAERAGGSKSGSPGGMNPGSPG